MKKKLIQIIISILAAGAAVGCVFAAKDSLVIYLGIRAFRLIRIGVIAAGGATVAGVLGSSVVTYTKMQEQLVNSRQEQLAIEEQHKRQTARLSVEGKLDNETLRTLLMQKGQGDWGMLGEQISSCIRQLVSMDDYQKRLAKLLASNGADTLYDTEDVLDQAEQGMCRNVRKVINYMEVADAKIAEDENMIRGKLSQCESQNREILKQSQEFVFALTEYLNRQGESAGDLSMLEIYKKTIMEAIGEEKQE